MFRQLNSRYIVGSKVAKKHKTTYSCFNVKILLLNSLHKSKQNQEIVNCNHISSQFESCCCLLFIMHLSHVLSFNTFLEAAYQVKRQTQIVPLYQTLFCIRVYFYLGLWQAEYIEAHQLAVMSLTLWSVNTPLSGILRNDLSRAVCVQSWN